MCIWFQCLLQQHDGRPTSNISRAFYYWGALGENPLVCRHKVLLLARVCTEAVQLLNYDMDLRFAVN